MRNTYIVVDLPSCVEFCQRVAVIGIAAVLPSYMELGKRAVIIALPEVVSVDASACFRICTKMQHSQQKAHQKSSQSDPGILYVLRIAPRAAIVRKHDSDGKPISRGSRHAAV